MFAAIRSFWKDQDTIEKKFFWMVTVIEVVITFISGVFTYFEELCVWAYVICFVTSGICFIFACIAYKTHDYGLCYMGSYYTIGIILLPAAFLFCGGVKSGMPVYCATLTLIGAVAPVSNKQKGIAFGVFLGLMSVVIYCILDENPHVMKYLTDVSEETAAIDVAASYILMSIAIYCIGAYVVGAYNKEREKREALVEKLDRLSKRDVMTDLYNRRYMINFLENVVWPRREKYYVVMFDIDNLKDANRQYGHLFGDRIIRGVAKVLNENISENCEESVIRYGGEEFLAFIQEDTDVAAFFRADKIRSAVGELSWEDNPVAHVTVSGMFIACRNKDFDDPGQLLHFVDELVHSSGNRGVDQIRSLSAPV